MYICRKQLTMNRLLEIYNEKLKSTKLKLKSIPLDDELLEGELIGRIKAYKEIIEHLKSNS